MKVTLVLAALAAVLVSANDMHVSKGGWVAMNTQPGENSQDKTALRKSSTTDDNDDDVANGKTEVAAKTDNLLVDSKGTLFGMPVLNTETENADKGLPENQDAVLKDAKKAPADAGVHNRPPSWLVEVFREGSEVLKTDPSVKSNAYKYYTQAKGFSMSHSRFDTEAWPRIVREIERNTEPGSGGSPAQFYSKLEAVVSDEAELQKENKKFVPPGETARVAMQAALRKKQEAEGELVRAARDMESYGVSPPPNVQAMVDVLEGNAIRSKRALLR